MWTCIYPMNIFPIPAPKCGFIAASFSCRYAEVEEIRQELVDRFGPVPEPVQNFLEIATLRIMAKSKDIKMLRRKGREVEIQVAGKLPADLHQRMRGMKFRRINDHTVRLNIERGSLMELHGLLSSI